MLTVSADVISQFTAALRTRDIIPPPELLNDGRLHRCDAAGRNGKGDATYLLHRDGVPAGGFENHRDGLGWENWHASVDRELTAAEREAQRRLIADARAQRDADDRERKAEAARRADAIWRQAAAECNGHPYLDAKHIGRPHGARSWRGRLVIPARDLEGTLHSLQFIAATGEKKFLTGGRVRGCCFVIGELFDGGVILLVEGFATAVTMYEATNYPVIAAFDAGNLPRVAAAVRRRYPAAKLVPRSRAKRPSQHRTMLNMG